MLFTVCLLKPVLSAKMRQSWEGVGKRSANGPKVSSGREGEEEKKQPKPKQQLQKMLGRRSYHSN